ncbi:MAG: DUF488 family protein [Bacteriovoracaceae bacterium]
MILFTIGFTQTSAEDFFSRLIEGGVKTVLDVRLHNTSQLSGFAKKDDLSFFLHSLGGITYRHCPELAPREDMLKAYRTDRNWDHYSKNFVKLLQERKIEKVFRPADIHQACLLCSESSPHHCHRRLVAEYLKEKWGKINIIHL